MARSSHGPRQATTWAAEHNPRPLPRIVRLGRPANDNDRGFRPTRIMAAIFVAAVGGVLALMHFHLI
jgi:hypothetical protein